MFILQTGVVPVEELFRIARVGLYENYLASLLCGNLHKHKLLQLAVSLKPDTKKLKLTPSPIGRPLFIYTFLIAVPLTGKRPTPASLTSVQPITEICVTQLVTLPP